MARATIKMSCNNICKGMYELPGIIIREIDADLIYENQRNVGSGIVVLLAFERFFLRNTSYGTLTIMLTEKDGVQTADIIGSGGGDGAFNISWGANSSFAKSAAKILQKYGYIESN